MCDQDSAGVHSLFPSQFLQQNFKNLCKKKKKSQYDLKYAKYLPSKIHV